MKRIDGLTIKEKIATIVNDGDGKYHKNKVEALVTLIQKEREEAVSEFVYKVLAEKLHYAKIVTGAPERWVHGYNSALNDFEQELKDYLSQTKGGEDGR